MSCYSLFHQNEVPVASRGASLLLQVFKLTFLEYLSPFLKVWCGVLWMLTWHQPLCPPEGIKWIIRGSGCLPWTSHLTRSLAFWRQFNFFVKIIASCKGPWIRLLGSYVPQPHHHTPIRSLYPGSLQPMCSEQRQPCRAGPVKANTMSWAITVGTRFSLWWERS